MLHRLKLLALALGFSASATAAVPVNDDWSNRIAMAPAAVLTPTGYSDTQVDIAEATTEASDPLLVCKNGDPAQRGNSVWYSVRFVGAGQDFHINLSALGYDNVIAIYTGTPGAFTPVVGGCNDDGASGLAAALNGVRLQGEVDYSIMVARPAQNSNVATLAFNARSAPLYAVTKTADTLDGSCNADCSLREAVAAANAAPGAILIPAGDYGLTRTGSDNTNANGDLDLTVGMAIHGAGIGTTRVLAQNNDRVFDLDPGNTQGHTFNFADLGIANGQVFSFGGGINASSGSTPGNEHLALQRVALRNNATQLAGGGLRSNGPTAIIDCIIAGNTAASDGGGLSFGGDANTRVDVAYTSISGNTSTSNLSGGGGGLHSSANTVVYNSTISGNSARNNGGGVLSTLASGRMNLIQVTVYGNRADSDGANGGNGGGLRIEGNFADVRGSAFAANVVGTGSSASDCDKPPGLTNVSFASNHLEAATSSCGFGAATGDVLGQPALLLALGDHGGVSETHVPGDGSPLIDSATSDVCLGNDQRRIGRPQDGDNNGSTLCDKGAVERTYAEVDPLFANGFEG